MLKKLRQKFVWITMTVIVVMLAVIFSLIYSFTRGNLESQSYATLQNLTQAVSQAGSLERLPRDVQVPWFMMQIDRGGFITAAGYTALDLNDKALLQTLLQAVTERGMDAGVLDSHQLMYRVVMGRNARLIVFLDISGYNATLRTLLHSSVLIGVLSILAFWVISIFLAKWAVRPVERAWQQQKQFVSDASHELKTPLSVIMSSAELLQSPDTTEEQRQRFTGSIMTMSQQMRTLVEGLLELARADNGQIRKNFERLDYSKLVRDTLLVFEPVLFEKGMTLEAEVSPDIWLRGNTDYLKQVTEILLDNAAKYSDPGVVSVQLQGQGKTCLLTVANPGTPIPPQEQKKIFARFYRADAARSRTGSFGLGLSIAKATVEEHGGKIWVKSNPTGNCFCVQLPCDKISTETDM